MLSQITTIEMTEASKQKLYLAYRSKYRGRPLPSLPAEITSPHQEVPAKDRIGNANNNLIDDTSQPSRPFQKRTLTQRYEALPTTFYFSGPNATMELAMYFAYWQNYYRDRSLS